MEDIYKPVKEEIVEQGVSAPVLVRLNLLVNSLQTTNHQLNALIEGMTTLVQASETALKLKTRSEPQQDAVARWKEANPEVSRLAKQAAGIISQKQTEYIEELSNKVLTLEESFSYDGDFQLKELLDSEGHRLHHLSLICSVLDNLGS